MNNIVNSKFGIDKEWIRDVQDAKTAILADSEKTPTQILVEVFEMCQDEFDVTMIEVKQPELYQILKKFCSNVPSNDHQLRDTSRDLARFFYKHFNEIRETDTTLYYAVSNFIDMLKTKRIYLAMVSDL